MTDSLRHSRAREDAGDARAPVADAPAAAPSSFDSAAFALTVHARRFMAEEAIATFAERHGVTRDTIFRAENRLRISIAPFLTLCHAFGEDPLTYLLDAGGKRVGVSRGELVRPDPTTPPEKAQK